MNLFHQPSDGAEAVQVTRHDDDAMWASADASGAIVYEINGRIWRFDPATGESQRQVIRVSADDVQARPRLAAFGETIESYALSPDGEQVLFSARGDLFAAGADDAPVRALTSSSDAQDREGAMSPDGRWVAYISDKGGEEELWLVPAAGGDARQVTRGNRNRFYRPIWTPDGKRIAMSGKDGAIHLVNVATGATREVGRSGSVFTSDHVWSPNSRYLAYTKFGSNDMGQVHIFDADTGTTIAASDPLYNSAQPAFAPDGNYLYLLVEREFATEYAGVEWNFQVARKRSIAALSLGKDLPDPFRPDDKAEKLPAMKAIDTNGLLDRLFRAPIPSGSIAAMAVTDRDILYSTASTTPGDETFQINALSFEKAETRVIDTKVDAYALSPWNKAVVTRKGKGYALLDTSAGKSRPVGVSRLTGTIEPRREWRAVFNGVCRRYRDFFYEPTMHGFDWSAICERYRQELPRIASRGDLTELIGRMVSELNVGHAYIDGADELQPSIPASAALGAELAFDHGRQRWKIARILPGDPIDPWYRSPLGAAGQKIREGDWILSIDGRKLDAETDPFEALQGKAEKEVALSLGRDGEKAPWSIVVKPVASQHALLYRDWSERNRQLVDRISGGRIGYVHIPAMSPRGLAEFARGYFSQIRKDAMIVDIRGNLGGSGSPLILDRLARPFLTTGHITGIDYSTTYPWGGFTQVFTGKLGLLVNEATMSDGDTMAYEWRQAGLGPIYGKRTWGGTVGTGSTGPLLDGTQTNVPQFALADTKGEWIVEGQGVTPDVEIGFDERARVGGDDPQLAEATRLLMAQTPGQPGTLPKGAVGPDKRVGLNK